MKVRVLNPMQWPMPSPTPTCSLLIQIRSTAAATPWTALPSLPLPVPLGPSQTLPAGAPPNPARLCPPDRAASQHRHPRLVLLCLGLGGAQCPCYLSTSIAHAAYQSPPSVRHLNARRGLSTQMDPLHHTAVTCQHRRCPSPPPDVSAPLLLHASMMTSASSPPALLTPMPPPCNTPNVK
jgi:hypothetical protein